MNESRKMALNAKVFSIIYTPEQWIFSLYFYKQLPTSWTELNDYCVELLNFPFAFHSLCISLSLPLSLALCDILASYLWTNCKFTSLLVVPILKSVSQYLQVFLLLLLCDVNYNIMCGTACSCYFSFDIYYHYFESILALFVARR